ncbi:hypothetical protein DIC66_07595 [Rhodoferax lacus]|uniref:Uncharacterized protein n=2 Tax=Rhodoferax lacus TaxID=2184758 RepID=A0A3E1REA9_9BURK|nr:hypothetical protein DIC66_07595 [Rhodoferax lacus]
MATFAAIPFAASAITFSEPASVGWTWMEDVESGCVAKLEAHNKIYVGNCANRIPHGRGVYFENTKLLSARLNNGKLYKTEPYQPNDPDLARFLDKAQYIASFHSIFLVGDEFQNLLPGPQDSAVYKLATRFIGQYQTTAQNDDLAQARLKQESAKQNGFARAYATVSNQQESALAARMLQDWQGQLTAEQAEQVKTLRSNFERQEQLARDKRAREDAEYAKRRAQEEEQRLAYRQSRIKTACNGFYPGYVARYNRGGFLGTPDRYVVRYLNAARSAVTIEGTDSGNSLAYGQMLELSCIDLLERTE